MKPGRRTGAAFAGLTVGLLGGSFNPAHEGHRAMSLHALKALGVDQVWWLVSPLNPLKNKKEIAPLGARIARAQAVADHPRIHVTGLEGALGTRFTVDTLKELRRLYPRTRFIWLMGADNLRQVRRWKKWPQIFTLVSVAVFRRPAYLAGRGLGVAAQRFARGWQKAESAKALKHLGPPGWALLNNPLNPKSATQIRKDDPSWHR